MAGAVILVILVILALAAPLFAKLTGHGPNDRFPDQMLTADIGLPKGPNAEFWFGGDSVGRDVFIRTLYGARTSLTVALVATGLAALLGVSLGMIAGYRGGNDRHLRLAADRHRALHAGAAAGHRPGQRLLDLAQRLPGRPPPARPDPGGRHHRPVHLAQHGPPGPGPGAHPPREGVRRGSPLAGRPPPRIMFKELLPNLLAPIVVYATLLIPANILFEAALSFLGVGVPQSTPSWGRMLSDASAGQIFTIAWWMMLFPGLFLLATTLSFNLVGDGLRDALGPSER